MELCLTTPNCINFLQIGYFWTGIRGDVKYGLEIPGIGIVDASPQP